MALTELGTLDITVGGAGPVHVIAGTASATTLTIYSPASNKSAFLVGQVFSEGTASNVSYLSSTTTLVTTELSANQGALEPINDGVIVGSFTGQALKISPSAQIDSAIFYVVEADRLRFS